MRSHELAAELLKHPDVELILQKDAEGNGYSPLRGVDFDVVYVPDNTWSGTVYDTSWSAEDADMDEGEWKTILRQTHMHAVLHPVN
jgi:hypothetical protein